MLIFVFCLITSAAQSPGYFQYEMSQFLTNFDLSKSRIVSQKYDEKYNEGSIVKNC